MNTLQTFTFDKKDIRVFGNADEPLFAAVDICKALDLDNARQAVSRLEEDERSTVILNDGNPGNPELNVVNEAGLYHLIMTSRLEQAKPFKRWVFHEVLPSIRKYGGYATNSEFRELHEALLRKKELMNERNQITDEIKLCTDQINKLQASITEAPIPEQLKVQERIFENMKVTKEDVIQQYSAHPKNGRDLFLGCKNMRTVRRWWDKLEKGESI